MKILILGASGMLGHMLVRVLTDTHTVFGTLSGKYESIDGLSKILPRERCIEDLDARIGVEVERQIEKVKPEIVINCIGLIKQKMNDDKIADAITLNSLLPHQLTTICENLDARLIHFSTDCVFQGTKGVKSLSDFPDALDDYGVTKRLGELRSGRGLTLRTSIVGRQISGSEGLFEWVLSQRGKSISGYRKAVYSGLTTLALAQVVKKIIEEHPNLRGTYQVASTPITKYELISELNLRLDLQIDLKENYEFECDRTLDGSKFFEITGVAVPSWESMLTDFIHDQGFYEGVPVERTS